MTAGTPAPVADRQGASIKAVQQQLGHRTPMVTLNVYAHLFEHDLDRLYEGLDTKFSERQTAFDGLEVSERRGSGSETGS